MTKKIGVLGTGNVGVALANGLKDLGYKVTLASRSGKKVDGWSGGIATFKDAAMQADLVVLAVKGTAAEELVHNLKTELVGKTVIDTTNPIADAAPVNGVLKFFTDLDTALMEKLQLAAPETNFVKAFNSVGAHKMVQPKYEVTPTMFICGDDENAKQEASEIIENLGWEIADMGKVESARAIEPLCMLWCIPAIANGQSTHAFKLLK